MIRFEVIKDVFTVKDEIQGLLELHYQELTLDKNVIKLDPDWHRYQTLLKENKLCIVVARDDDLLVGYSVFFLDWHIHYKNNMFARNDVLFLAPSHRQGMTGIKLIKYSEMVLEALNVSKITWHIKYSKDFRKILHRLGYQDEEVVVSRALKEL